MSVRIKYSDIAIGAKEEFEVEAEGYLSASNLSLLKQDFAEYTRYDTPLDLNSMLLDGESKFLPESAGEASVAYISEQISNDVGDFEEPISMVFVASSKYISSGITLNFDGVKGLYATRVKIEWYGDNELINEKNFYPDSVVYFCNEKVEFYDKISITFYSMNLPYSRLILNAIEHGMRVDFGGNELRSAKIIQEIDPISASVPVNPFDFSIDSKKNIDFSFQTKQPIEVYFNNKLRALCFVKSANRRSKTIWDIRAEDYIGLMDSIPFAGGIYENKNATELIAEIFLAAKIPYNILSGMDGKMVSGYIPYTNCREALMQVCFATQTVADTSNSDVVNIYALSHDVSQLIDKSRIMQGQRIEDFTRVTSVQLTAHAFVEVSETITAYDASKSGYGDGIFVSFTEPLHDLYIDNGEIIESGVNYAVINASNDSCILNGQKYKHLKTIKTKNNPRVLSTDIENVVSIYDATLVSANNVDDVLDSCYNYIATTEQAKMKIVDGKHREKPKSSKYGESKYGEALYGVSSVDVIVPHTPTSVGDLIEYETALSTVKKGRIIRQSFSLGGGILIKDSVVR